MSVKTEDFMKKVMTSIATLVLAAIITIPAFASTHLLDGTSQNNSLKEQVSSPICFDRVSHFFERLDAILNADDGYLWGISLHGPVVIADALTGYAVANMPDADGEIFTKQGDLYIGHLPEGTHIGNTASFFGETLWGMVTWGLIEAKADDIDSIILTILHELFHAQQHNVFEGWRSNAGRNPHMRELDSRVSIRLELNALLTALSATGDERLAAVHDALSIRAERRFLNTYAIPDENSFEIVEGTAVYTEAVLGRDNLDDRIALVESYMNLDSEHIPDQFGYHSGALYALLLDEFAVDWRNGLSWDCDLSELLKKGIGFTEPIPFNEIDLEQYGYSEIRPLEEAWTAEIERLTQAAWDALSGPLLLIDAMGEFGQEQIEYMRILFLRGNKLHSYEEFDYGDDDVYLLDDERHYENTVFYGDFNYSSHVGELEVTGSFLMLWRVMWRHGIPAYNIEVEGSRITGPGWVLTLNDGYELMEINSGHYRIVK